MRPAWPRWVALVLASAAMGAACSNSSQAPAFEETSSYPPLLVPCPCEISQDGAVSFFDAAPDSCSRPAPDASAAGCVPAPVSGTGM